MIELAPHHKQGLPIDNPVILGCGTIGYGESLPQGMSIAAVGAAIIGPFTLQPRSGTSQPRLAVTNGGMVLNTGGQSRGVKAPIRKFRRLWAKLGVPLVAQITEPDSDRASSVAAQLSRCNEIYGFEVSLDERADVAVLGSVIRAIVETVDLPLWAKLPLENVVDWADVAIESGADALVIGQPPQGSLPVDMQLGQEGISTLSGSVYGPLTFAQTWAALERLGRLDIEVPIIASGGIHTIEQMQQVLSAGAAAIQVDSAMWIEPALPLWFVEAWEASTQ